MTAFTDAQLLTLYALRELSRLADIGLIRLTHRLTQPAADEALAAFPAPAGADLVAATRGLIAAGVVELTELGAALAALDRLDDFVVSADLSTCIGCGCDDLNACQPHGCYWLREDPEAGIGVCSECAHLAEDWDRGVRAVAPKSDQWRTEGI